MGDAPLALPPCQVNVGFALGSPVPALRSGSQRFGGARHASARKRRGFRPICARAWINGLPELWRWIPQAADARTAVRPNRQAARPAQGRHTGKISKTEVQRTLVALCCSIRRSIGVRAWTPDRDREAPQPQGCHGGKAGRGCITDTCRGAARPEIASAT